MRKLLLLAAVAACSVASPALADPVTLSYDFTGTDFTAGFGAGGAAGPADAFTGSFSYSFDATTQAFQLLSFNGHVGSLEFTTALADFNSSGTGDDSLTIGGSPGGASGFGASDFVFNMLLDRTTGAVTSAYQLGYITQNFSIYHANNLSVTAAVPEPATWAMMLLGFGGIGFAMRRGRKQNRRLLQVA